MPVEIELKAHVNEAGETKAAIAALAEYAGAFEKEDAYWYPAGGTPGVRIRRERMVDGRGRVTGGVRVTTKFKETRDGVEVNDEREFEASDGAAVGELLTRLGLKQGAVKYKRGWAWNAGGVTVELCRVSRGPNDEGLGWFAELEILASDDGAETVAAARKRLEELLDRIGIGADRIEERYYTAMLRDLPGSSPTAMS